MIFDRNGRQIEFSLDREIIFLDDVFTMLRTNGDVDELQR